MSTQSSLVQDKKQVDIQPLSMVETFKNSEDSSEVKKIVTQTLTQRPRQKKTTPTNVTFNIQMPTTSDITSEVNQLSHSSQRSSQSKVKEKKTESAIEISSISLIQLSGDSSSSENSRDLEKLLRKKNYELMPRTFKTQNFVNPGLKDLQRQNIDDFEKHASHFAATSREVYSTNQLVTDQQKEEIKKLHNDLVFSANNIVQLMQTGQYIETGSKNIRRVINIDFLSDLKQFFTQCSFSAKIVPYLKSINDELKDLFIINFKDCRHDNRIKFLITELNLEIDKKKSPELEKMKKEIMILHRYRQVMLDLANNLIRVGKVYDRNDNESSHIQEKILKKVEALLAKLFRDLQKHDKGEIELKKYLKVDGYDSYKSIIYNSIATVIRTQVIEIFWINANKVAQTKIIQFRSDQLKSANKHHALFCSDCLKAFDDSLNTQKYDFEFLLGWRRMVGGASVVYIDGERNVLLEPRRIPEPADTDDQESMQRYFLELESYGQDSMSLLSKCAFFDDQTFLGNFFKVAVELSQDTMSQLPPATDPLEVHARIFSFLETLLGLSAENKKMLKVFNNKLLLTNSRTIKSLEQKAQSNRQTRLGAEMAIQFMLRFYRSLNHKYIMVPINNLEEMYKLVHSTEESIIKKDVQMFSLSEGPSSNKETAQPARFIYIVLGGANFEVHSVRVDEINPGPNIEGTYCYIYTYTSVREPYPGELAWLDSKSNPQLIPHTIEFSYQRVKPENQKGSTEETQAIESAIQEKIRLFGLLIDAAGFPNFVERFVEAT